MAEALFADALDGRRAALGAAHPETLATQTCLAGLRLEQGALRVYFGDFPGCGLSVCYSGCCCRVVSAPILPGVPLCLRCGRCRRCTRCLRREFRRGGGAVRGRTERAGGVAGSAPPADGASSGAAAGDPSDGRSSRRRLLPALITKADTALGVATGTPTEEPAGEHWLLRRPSGFLVGIQ